MLIMTYSIRHILIGFLFLAVALALLSPIRGMFPPFYYEQYNAVRSRLDAIDGLQIRDSWQHEDVVLEDCGFEITVGGQNASIDFVDHQDWVELFSEIDGIRISIKDQQRLIAREQLNSAGINISGLDSVLENLKAVSDFCSGQLRTTDVPNAEYDYQKYLKYAKMRFH